MAFRFDAVSKQFFLVSHYTVKKDQLRALNCIPNEVALRKMGLGNHSPPLALVSFSNEEEMSFTCFHFIEYHYAQTLSLGSNLKDYFVLAPTLALLMTTLLVLVQQKHKIDTFLTELATLIYLFCILNTWSLVAGLLEPKALKKRKNWLAYIGILSTLT